MFPRRKTVVGARKSVRPVTSTFRVPVMPTPPTPPVICTTTTTPISPLPLKKHARFTLPALPSDDTLDLPPPPVY